MKKTRNIIFVTMLAVLCMFFAFPKNQKTSYADELPSYFSNVVSTKGVDDNSSITYTPTDKIVVSGDAVTLGDNQALVFQLGEDVQGPQYAISYFSMQIVLDGKTIETRDSFIGINQHITTGEYNIIKIIFDPNQTNDETSNVLTGEGKYTVTINYMECYGTDYSLTRSKSLTQTFFVFKSSTYFNNFGINADFANVNQSYKIGSSSSYANLHQFFFTNNQSTSYDTLQLPTLTYDTTKFEIEVRKKVLGLDSTCKIYVDENQNLVKTSDIVKIYDKGNGQAEITFNDIGEYSIHYTLLHKGEKLENLTNSTKYDKLNIIGVQAFVQNYMTQNEKIEFKHFDQTNLLEKKYQSDVSYLNVLGIDGSNKLVLSSENESKLPMPTTNQVPVEFKFNASINTENSFVFKKENNQWVLLGEFDGSPIADEGTYIIKVEYTSSVDYNKNATHEQWFAFKIDNQVPTFKMLDENNNIVFSNTFTNKTIKVENGEDNLNPFASQTKLVVYSKDYSQTDYANPVIVSKEQPVLFTENKNYKVEMQYGKGLSKSINAFFTIDNTPISGINARIVEKTATGENVKTSDVDFFTNQSFTLEWNEKLAKNNTISCHYKYFPLTKTNLNLTNAVLNTYYNQDKSIPVEFEINYSSQSTPISYSNTISNNLSVDLKDVLSEQGLYIFKLEDKAGNSAYKAVVLDGTSPKILQKLSSNDTFITDFSSINILAENSVIYWGKYKVFKFANLNLSDYEADWQEKDGKEPLDEYIKYALTTHASTDLLQNQDCNFKKLTINGTTSLFFASQIKTQNVDVLIGQNLTNANQTNYGGGKLLDEYSYEIVVEKDGVVYENTYTFFVTDESNIKGSDAATHSVIISTDISKTMVRFKQNQTYQNLDQHNYNKVEENTKHFFYMPINQDILQLQYIITPTQNSIELESVQIEFYPFIDDYLIFNGSTNLASLTRFNYYTLLEKVLYVGPTDDYTANNQTKTFTTNTEYTLEELLTFNVLKYKDFQKGKGLVLKKQPTIITVYDYSQGINLASEENGIYVYDINTSYNSQTKLTQSQEGKYVVKRTYKELSGTSSLVGSKHDYMTRTLTFIVDRQNIFSSPVMINTNLDGTQAPNYEFTSRVGGSAYIQVLDENNKFVSLYRANTQQDANSPILETNKLPVSVNIPVFKFGEMINGSFTTYSNLLFYDENPQSYINSFELEMDVVNLATNQKTTTNYTITVSNTYPTNTNNFVLALTNGLYLIFENVSKDGFIKLEFSDNSTYQINIRQNTQNLKNGTKNNLTFFVKIISIAPEFSISDINGNQLSHKNDTYYTNQNKLLLSWNDSNNEFLAKIDKTKIYYYINSSRYIVNPDDIVTDSYSNKVEIDISKASQNSTVSISMQYEGDPQNYPAQSFSITKKVEIDKIAPTQSIEKLIANSNEPGLINIDNLREGHNQETTFNRSTTNTGNIFYNFAFPVERSTFKSLIFDSTDKSSLYVKKISDKYTNANYKELDITAPNALQQVTLSSEYQLVTALDINNIATSDKLSQDTYYEIVEIDESGNITVYSVYLVTIQNTLTSNFITYQSNYETKEVSVNEMLYSSNKLTLTAKNNLTINSLAFKNYPWLILTYNNNKYIYSPDLTSTIYKYTTSGLSQVKPSEEFNFNVNTYNYVLSISNLPTSSVSIEIAVTNKSLSVIEPQKSNEAITINASNATSTTKIDWDSITLYELKADGVTSLWATYKKGISNPINYSAPEASNLALVSINGEQTIFAVSQPNIGSYYRYEITDNFHDKTIIEHLYGETFIDTIINHDGNKEIVKDVIDGKEYYLSNKSFTFNYYGSITQNLKVNIYKYDKQNNINVSVGEYSPLDIPSDYATVSNHGSYMSLELNSVQNEMIVYQLSIRSVFGGETQSYNFIVYNIIPNITLKGRYGQNLNGLMQDSINMTSEPVTLEYENTQNCLYPVEVYVKFNNGQEVLTPSKTIFDKPGNYTIIRKYTNAMNVFDIKVERFQITNTNWQFYSVVQYDSQINDYVEVEKTNSAYTLQSKNQSINNHYIVNTLNYKINVNQSQLISYKYDELTPQGQPDIKNNVETYIFTISNHDSTEPNINFYESKIAISYVPTTDKLIDRFFYIDHSGNEKTLAFSQASYSITKDVENSNSVIVSWNSYHKISENKIKATIKYGEDNSLVDNSQITSNDSTSKVVLNKSGLYYFTFEDMAGNIHKFDYNTQIISSTSTYEFIYLKDVIFTVNDQAPINYAIYNDEVKIQIPSYTLSYYDSNAKPQINVLRNGQVYEGFTASTQQRSYTFKEAGLYQVTFSAKNNQNDLREEKFFFQIIKENELYWAFDIERYENYYVEKIVKDNEDITDQLSIDSIGALTYVQTENENGEIVTKPRLRNIIFSIYDEKTGKGTYEITIATQNSLSQKFTYSFKLGSATPPIEISLEEGESTDEDIYVRFNAQNLFDSVGDCIIKVPQHQDIILNSEYFENGGNTVYDLKIDQTGTHYIQIYTAGGKLIYSYKVVREEPLNTIAWILIIVGILVAIAGTVGFVLLRKRMKIR